MPIPTLPKAQGTSNEELINYLAKLQKEVQWLLANLDTKNVRQLDADVINAGTLDAGLVTVRSDLTSGYIQIDSTGLKANDGTKNTFEINSSGKAYFRGDITSDANIIGATFKTADSGVRIEFSGNAFKTYNSSDKYNGMVFGEGIGSKFGDVNFYHNGYLMLQIYDAIDHFELLPTSPATSLIIGDITIPTYIRNFYVMGASTQVGSLSQSDSLATDVGTITNDFNLLLSKLRSMKILT